MNKIYVLAPPKGYLTKNNEDWIELPEDHRSSTIAHFDGGYKHPTDPIEIQFWIVPSELYGITTEGKVVTGWDMDEKYDLIHTGEGYARVHEPKELLAREIRVTGS